MASSAGSAGRPGPPLAPLLALCFLSGIAGLIYQVVWTQWLALSFGSGIVAASAVVAGFLGGTGVGAALFHRFDRGVRPPLVLYAWIELGIALATAAVATTFDRLPRVIAAAAGVLPPGLAIDLFRVVAVFALLLAPAALIGATYPALCRVVVRSRAAADRELGWIYGVNTLGAALGAVVAGFLLIEWLGLRGALLVANGTNVLVGVGALALARRSAARAAERAAPADEPLPTSLPFATTAAVLVLSGFATISYEVLWFRALRYLVGNSSYAVTTSLTVFLLGLGLGSLLYPRVVRRQPERALAWIQLATALSVLLALACEEWILRTPALKATFSIFGAALGDRGWGWRLASGFAASALLLLPGTLCMGLSFPIASRLSLGSVGNVGRRAGLAYFLANVGSIAGSVGTALVTLPWLGSVGGMRAVAGLNLLLGAWLLSRAPEGRESCGKVAAFALVTASLVLALALPERLSFTGAGMAFSEGELVFEEEGELATVQVRQQRDQPANRAMLIDGTIIGVSPEWYAPLDGKQQVLAHLPMVLHPRATRTLNVGLGSASTLAALADYDSIERLDAVEINAAVARAASLFEAGRVVEDPRARVVVEDVLHALLREREPYDLIVSDGKQNEDFAGNARVLSAEFYRYARARLAPGGLIVQWIPLGTPSEDLRIILRTMLSELTEVEVFFYMPESIILVGSEQRIDVARAMDAARFEALGIGERLRPLQVVERDALLAGWVAGREGLASAVGEGPRNEWNRLLLEYGAYRVPRSHKRRSDAQNMRLLLGARRRSLERGALVAATTPEARSMQLLREGFLAYKEGSLRDAIETARRALALRPSDPLATAALRDYTNALAARRAGAARPAPAQPRR